MKTKWIMTAGLVALCGMAQASVLTLTLNEDGGNLVATVSGSLNTSALTFNGNSFWNGIMSPLEGVLIVGPTGTGSVTVALWNLQFNDSAFGLNTMNLPPNSFSSDVAGIDLSHDRVMVPNGYVSGTELTGSATWNSQSFSSQNINQGTYTATYNDGTDSVVLQVGAIPEPGSALLIGCAGLLIAGYRRSRKS
jgi:hypothetical protein